jgi:hypothetical protein
MTSVESLTYNGYENPYQWRCPSFTSAYISIAQVPEFEATPKGEYGDLLSVPTGYSILSAYLLRVTLSRTVVG